KTSVPGVSIVKLPTKNEDLNFGLELLPVNEDGTPLKRKGVFITSLEQWEAYKMLLNDPKAQDLITNIDDMRKQKAVKSVSEDNGEVLEL
ncbi:MAG: hypothetical protein KGD64_09385, partial [Candidatus Heimdallarchaeota archaeon]|nr:hypothetical protein [Candidatus Heimdallarchaeota archaeon]